MIPEELYLPALCYTVGFMGVTLIYVFAGVANGSLGWCLGLGLGYLMGLLVLFLTARLALWFKRRG